MQVGEGTRGPPGIHLDHVIQIPLPHPATHPIPLVLPDHTHYIVLEMLTLTEMHSREVDPEDTVVDGG